MRPLLRENKVEIAQMVAFHINSNTDSVNKLYHKLNGIKAKAAIGWQTRKKNWPPNQWSNVVLFYEDNIAFPNYGPDWEFRHVYVDV